jgi:hypothetical protein
MARLALFVAAVILAGTAPAAAQSRLSIGFFGGITRIAASGKASDYSPGINPFPVVPSHDDQTLGCSLTWRFLSGLHLEVSGDYTSSLKDVVLTDPSDGDHIRYKPLESYHALLSLVADFEPSSKLTHFVRLGGGARFVRGSRAGEGRTEWGYAYRIDPTDPAVGPVASGGAGLRWRVVPGLTARLEAGVLVDQRGAYDIRLNFGILMF